MGAPYSERDLHASLRKCSRSTKRKMSMILVKDGPRSTRVTHGASSLRCRRLGWLSSIRSRLTRRISNRSPAPSINRRRFIRRLRFAAMLFAPFAPRLLDTHPEAVKIPWVHDNVEADEVLFYVRGNFGSRRGIEAVSITLHPRGIPHGPHPGHDHGEQECDAHRRAGRDVRHRSTRSSSPRNRSRSTIRNILRVG